MMGTAVSPNDGREREVCSLCPFPRRGPRGLSSFSYIPSTPSLPQGSSTTLLSLVPREMSHSSGLPRVLTVPTCSGADTAITRDSWPAISPPSQQNSLCKPHSPGTLSSWETQGLCPHGLCGASQAHSAFPLALHLTQKQLRCWQTAVLNYSAIKAKDKLPAAPACD